MECRGIRVEGALESTLDALREVAGSIPALPSSSRNAARPFSLDKLQSVRSSSLTCVTPLVRGAALRLECRQDTYGSVE